MISGMSDDEAAESAAAAKRKARRNMFLEEAAAEPLCVDDDARAHTAPVPVVVALLRCAALG